MLRRGLAAVCLLAANPAGAYTPDQLDCIERYSDAELPADMIDAAIGDTLEPEEREAHDRDVNAVIAACILDLDVPPEAHSDFAKYVKARLLKSELVGRLKASAIPVSAIDDALDFGPGRSNPQFRSVSKEIVSKVDAALSEHGIALVRLSVENLTYIGAYLTTASLYYGLQPQFE